jgi:hypothetical protein
MPDPARGFALTEVAFVAAFVVAVDFAIPGLWVGLLFIIALLLADAAPFLGVVTLDDEWVGAIEFALVVELFLVVGLLEVAALGLVVEAFLAGEEVRELELVGAGSGEIWLVGEG